jgi:DNA mismatch endonuclease (patch repair protein)
MSANKAKNTSPELRLRRALWSAGLRGYRLHPKKVIGRPDIAFISRKLAIFVHGCFWHRCPTCNYKLPKNNRTFWRNKFKTNVARDARKVADLTAAGWTVLTFWECDLKRDLPSAVKAVRKAHK